MEGPVVEKEQPDDKPSQSVPLMSEPKRRKIDDPITALELGKLSDQDRLRYQEEIKVGLMQEESPEFVESRLAQMEEAIESLRHRSASAYNLACFLAPRIVKDRSFRLTFLRSERFDSRAAAKRLIKNHFRYKMDLFGEDKVAKPITLEDFDEDDMSSLKSGAVQLLPCPDTSGRSILWFAASQVNYKSWKNGLRILWYMLISALENQNAQRKGVVLVIYVCDAGKSDSKMLNDLIMNSYLLRDGLPVKLSAIHYCNDSERSRPCLSLLRSVGGTDFRLRCMDHFGTHNELQYQLSQYGIAAGILPVDALGTYWTDDLDHFVQTRRLKEEGEKYLRQESPNLVEVATRNDVLFGRGKPFQEHEGNVKLSKLIESRQAEYMKANRAGKTSISWEIVRLIQSDGGAFLKKDESSGAWKKENDEVSREKVSHGFRTKSR